MAPRFRSVVLDVDSTEFAAFDEIDARGLEAVCRAMLA